MVFLRVAVLHRFYCMFCLIVLIGGITASITGRNVLTFITGAFLPSSCYKLKSKCKFTLKGVVAQLRPLEVLTYSKTCVKRPLSKRQKMVFKTD